ncbi:MAG: hypothetical protein ACYTG0_15380 [Planctomycetota bacterium]
MSDELNRLKQSFFRALSPTTFADICQKLQLGKPTDPAILGRMADAQGVITLTMVHQHLSVDELKRIANAVGVDLPSGDDVAMARRIMGRFREVQRDAVLREKKSTFEELMERAASRQQAILVLESGRKRDVTGSAIAYWHQNADFEADWIVADLSQHPNPAIKCNKRLRVRSVDYDKGSADLTADPLKAPSEDWIPLYAYKSTELPSLEALEQCEQESLTDDEDVLQAYDLESRGRSLVGETHFFFGRSGDPYDDVYAQLGGWAVTWPDESFEEQIDRQLVLRTYANSEPWIEVFKDREGGFSVAQRIT